VEKEERDAGDDGMLEEVGGQEATHGGDLGQEATGGETTVEVEKSDFEISVANLVASDDPGTEEELDDVMSVIAVRI